MSSNLGVDVAAGVAELESELVGSLLLQVLVVTKLLKEDTPRRKVDLCMI